MNNNNNNNNSTTMIVLEVTGMMCQKNCGSTVQQALLNVHGVTHVQVSFPHSRAIVVGTHNMSASDAIDAVECVGFDAQWLPHEDGPKWLQQLQTETSQQQLQQQQSSPTSVLDVTHHDTDNDVSQDEHTIMLQVLGMSCAVCVGRVETVLLGVEGVHSAKVVLATNRAQVTLDPSFCYGEDNDKDDIAQQCVEAVHQDGYDCRTIQTKGLSLHENAAQMQQARHQELQHWKCLLLVALLFTIPIMILHYSKTTILQQHYIIWKQVLMGVLATVVQICVGKRYYQAAYKAWPTMGMDSLIVMGTTASYVYSVVTLFILLTIQEATSTETTLEPTFETGAMLLSFVTFGKYLEAYAKGKTASALQHLMELQPVVALKVIHDNDADESLDYPQETIASLQTQQVDVSQLQVGDVVMVMPGARIPADGVLKSCNNNSKSCFIDESALSGEPFPVCKQVGEPVYGATVNQLSVALVQITATGSQTVLAKICHLVEQAQTNKAPIQTKADQIASTFCPTVLILAFLTFAGWIIYGITFSGQSWQHFMVGALTSSIAVVVVACPCALGLATPTAVMVGTGVGATHGLLIKGGAVLECAHQASTIVLDKTGTLTTGRAVLGHVQPIDTTTMTLPNHLPPTTTMTQKDAVLWLAACAESQSEHPLAKAICNAATATWGNDYTTSWFQSHDGTQVSQSQIVPGSGVECLISNHQDWNCRVRVGNKAFVQCTSAEADEALLQLRQAGQVGVYVSVHTNNDSVDSSTWKVVGVLGIVDPVVSEAKSTVAALQQQMGLDVWMCTGDHQVTALGVAHQVGIDPQNVVAGVSPEEKADLVSRLGDRVVFVGDGINDAIALARAHVGVAIGAGTEIAVEAADMVLVKSCLHDVVVALHLSRVVFDRIRLNFVWAMGYNLVALPFAAGILVPVLGWRLPPEFAGLMMAFSSVSVVTSSLLLRLYSKPTISQEGKLQVHGCLARLCTCQSAICGGVWSNCLCGPCNYCIAKICSCRRRQRGGRRMRRVAVSEMEYDSDCMDEMTSLDEHVEIV